MDACTVLETNRPKGGVFDTILARGGDLTSRPGQ